MRPHGLSSPWNSPGQNTGVGSLSLLQGISPTQGSNPGLPRCRQILYPLSHKGKRKKKKNTFLNNPGSKSEINTKATQFLPEVMEHAKVVYRVRCIYLMALFLIKNKYNRCRWHHLELEQLHEGFIDHGHGQTKRAEVQECIP